MAVLCNVSEIAHMPTFTMLARAAFVPVALATALSATAQTQTPQTPSTGSTATPPSASGKATLDAAFKQADTDADGKLSNAELSQIPALASKFADLDKNKDGSVSSDEFSAGVAVKGQ
jgi:hypothetical protein